MLLRIWRTGVDPNRWREYERFERDRSLPMFRAQPGCRGVLFVRTAEGSGAAACTFWDDQAAIDRLATSPTYQQTVEAIHASRLLQGDQIIEVFQVATAALSALPGVQRFG